MSNNLIELNSGSLTLEQIKLIFEHLPVDISFVDEKEIVKFFNNKEHKVFARHLSQLEKTVYQVHPKHSEAAVKMLVKAFKENSESGAEFWIDMGKKFIHITYIAIRDKQGEYKGILEMTQDITHAKSLIGSQKTPVWIRSKAEEVVKINDLGLIGKTKLKQLFKDYPELRYHLANKYPSLKRITEPFIFKMMISTGTIQMLAEKAELTTNELLDEIIDYINEKY
ncbi:MAG: PAS domain-containing protein [Erysipelotrichaceae bacterium]